MGADRSRMIRCPMNEVSLLWMLHALGAGIHHTAEGHCSSGFGHNTCCYTNSSGQRSINVELVDHDEPSPPQCSGFGLPTGAKVIARCNQEIRLND